MSQHAGLRTIVGPLNVYGTLALAGVVGPMVLIAADLTAAFSNPNYNIIRNSISSLAWTPLGWIQTLGFLVIGLLVEVFVAGLFFSIRGVRGFGLGNALLVCFGFGLLLIGAFPTDLAGAPSTIHGTIHGIASKGIFVIFPFASLLIAFSLKQDSYWKGLFIHTVTTSGIALALLIGWFFLHKISWFGLYERILVANAVIWIEVMALRLLHLSFNPRWKAEKSA